MQPFPTEMPLVEDKQVFALYFEPGEGEDGCSLGEPLRLCLARYIPLEV